ncbi:MAG: hypothetical protein IKX42_07325 [Fibrobacter sp.]|nr:hypothetical protein [Fibrobacter sp.]
MNCKIILATAALLATQSFAIIGIGAHYSPLFGNTLKPEGKGVVTDDISFSHEGYEGTMQGFGFKLWIDLLPVIDIEGTFNVRFGSYDASLYVKADNVPETEIPLEIELGGTPFGKANPKFVSMTGDISITYPITFIPIIRPYIGGGLTVFANSFVLNNSFVGGLIGDPSISEAIQEVATLKAAGTITPEAQQALEQKLSGLGETVKQRVQDQAMEEGVKTSIGGHVLIGLRAKLPVIPIAAYSNVKFYFGGDFPEEVDPGIVALELGIGLAL